MNNIPPISEEDNEGELDGLGATDVRRLILWVRAGGRCELDTCNRYLLTNEARGEIRYYPVGEVAHNAGRSKKATRGSASVPLERRNDLENLLLLCAACHSEVDKKVNEGEFTLELLRGMKQRHESRILYLTGIKPGMTTHVIRMVGNVRGFRLEISSSAVRHAVVRGTGRYPRFFLPGHDTDIDLRSFDEEDPAYWEQAARLIRRRVDHFLTPSIGESLPDHISVISFARIPLNIYLGACLGDKIPTAVFQKQRDGEEAWEWKDSSPVAFEVVRHSQAGRDVVLVFSLSGRVDQAKIPEEIRSTHSILEVQPVDTEPSRTILESRESLANFRQLVQSTLRNIEASGAEAIVVVPAVPVSAAFTIGRERLPGVTPVLHVYDLEGDSYCHKLTIEKEL